MPIQIQAAEMFEAVKRGELDSLSPFQRRHLADVLRYLAEQADPDKPEPAKAGVLAALKGGRQT